MSSTNIHEHLDRHLLVIIGNLIWEKGQRGYATLRTFPNQSFLCVELAVNRIWTQDRFPQTTGVLPYYLVCRERSCIFIATTHYTSASMSFSMMPKLMLPHVIESLLEVYHLHMIHTTKSIPFFKLSNKEWLKT